MGFFDKALAFAANPISTGSQLLGSEASGADYYESIPFLGQAVSANKNREFSAQQAAINRSFQERMSGSAYQRAAADMEKAGLNRILSIGSPASTPAGSVGQGSMPQDNTSSAMSLAKLAGVDKPLAKAEIAKKGGELKNIEENIVTQKTTQKLNSANAAKASADADLKAAQTRNQILKNVPESQRAKALKTLGPTNMLIRETADTFNKAGAGAKSTFDALGSLGKLFKGAYNSISNWWNDDDDEDDMSKAKIRNKQLEELFNVYKKGN